MSTNEFIKSSVDEMFVYNVNETMTRILDYQHESPMGRLFIKDWYKATQKFLSNSSKDFHAQYIVSRRSCDITEWILQQKYEGYSVIFSSEQATVYEFSPELETLFLLRWS
jgi:hypothetical protein